MLVFQTGGFSTISIARASEGDLSNVAITPSSPTNNNSPIVSGDITEEVDGIVIMFDNNDPSMTNYTISLSPGDTTTFTSNGLAFCPETGICDINQLPDGDYAVSVDIFNDDPFTSLLDNPRVVSNNYLIDTIAPTIAKIETQDKNTNGKIDAFEVTMNEPIIDSSIDISDFAIANYIIDSIETGELPNDRTFELIVSEQTSEDGGATPTINYIQGTLSDLAGNLLVSANTISQDNIQPIIISALVNPNPTDEKTLTVVINFSELIDTLVEPTVAISGISDENIAVSQLQYSDKTWIGSAILPTIFQAKTGILSMANAADAAGNIMKENLSVATFEYNPIVLDATAPIGTIKINNKDVVTNSTIVNLQITASDDIAGLDAMQFSTDNISWTDWEEFNTEKIYTLPEGDGDKTIYARFKDKAGNISEPVSDSIFYGSRFEDTNNIAYPENNIVDSSDPTSLYFDGQLNPDLSFIVSEEFVGTANIIYGKYIANPETSLPTGITGIGKYYEIYSNPVNPTIFPVMIRIYYTQADLDAAGITDETQITGIYFFNNITQVWELYTDTGAITTDYFDGVTQYAGFVWANADHFTPITFGAETAIPQTSAPTTTTTSPIQVTTTTTTAVQIVLASSVASGIIDQTPTETAAAAPEPTVLKNNITTTTTIAPLAEKIGEIKGEEDADETSNRTLVTIIILLIALAAGVGGYYGYEYWLASNAIKSEKTTPKKPKNAGRW